MRRPTPKNEDANTNELASISDVYSAVCWPSRAALRITRDPDGSQVRRGCRMG